MRFLSYYTMVKRLFVVVFVLSLFLGCAKLNPKIAVPSYLQIDNYSVITDTNTQGTNNQKFSDVLVESSTSNYGYYPMPGKIPLLFTGATYLIIRPVIKVNGVSALRLDYPFMKGYDTTFALTSGQVTKITPVFKYYPTLNFKFIEDFENTLSYKMVNSNSADTFGFKIATNSSYPGSQMAGSSRCMLMQLDANHTLCQAQSFYAYTLPNDGANIYLEINYKSNTDFEVGLIGTDNPSGALKDQRSIGGANASAGWNKIYFSLGDITRVPPTYPFYYVYFYKGNYDPATTTNQIFIDNIKLISQY